MSHSLTPVTLAAPKWPHAQAKSWQCTPEMKLSKEVMVMRPEQCSLGSAGLYLRGVLHPNELLESKAPILRCGIDSILQSKERREPSRYSPLGVGWGRPGGESRPVVEARRLAFCGARPTTHFGEGFSRLIISP